MKWNRLYLRDMIDEEKELFGDEVNVIWDGDMPEDGEYVIIKRFKDDDPVIDRWEHDDEGFGFYYNNDLEDCYWCPVPEFEV